ncbi:MAG: NAD-dependent epimerase/dehydratase family protein [Bacteroidetes bacterium]|nr:NAD-dependent epimerase/dehydratase family protein [Bacteroidota bacterium]
MTEIQGNILLTGATGFLGFRTLERLSKLDTVENIIACGRTLRPEAKIDSPKIHYQLGDLTNPDYVRSLFENHKIDYIIHCAALSSPWGTYQQFYQTNVLPQRNLIKRAEEHQIKRFVFISSPSVYSNFKDRLNVKESDPLPAKSVNQYAATKREAEILLEKSTLNWISLRPRALVGRGDTVIMPRVIRAVNEGRLKIIGNGENIADLTPVSNVVDAILLSLTAPSSALGKVYNISNGNPVRLWDAIQKTISLVGLTPPNKKVPASVAMTAASVMEFLARYFTRKEPVFTRYGVSVLAQSFTMDISLAREYLGYEPHQSTEEAIEEFVDWYQANHS